MKKMLLSCCGMMLLFGSLQAAVPVIVTDIPDIVICNNKDAAGNDDLKGYYYEDAFDLRDYISYDGADKNDLFWGFEVTSKDAGSATSILMMNGKADIDGVYTENITGVGEAGEVDPTVTFAVATQPIDPGTETVELQVSTGIEGESATDSFLVTYVDDGSEDSLVGWPPPQPPYYGAGWNSVDVYHSQGSYGAAVFLGASQEPEVNAVGDHLFIQLDNGQYMSYVNDGVWDVSAGRTYLVRVPVKVNFTQNGTGQSSYPIIRLMGIYEENGGVKVSDDLMYMGATPAQNQYVDYCFCFTAESDAEDFKIRLDVLNGTGSSLSVDFEQINVYDLPYNLSMDLHEDWADTIDWTTINVYNTFGEYGQGNFSGASQVPAIADNQLSIQLDNSQYMSFVNSGKFDVLGAGQYLVKIPVKVNYSPNGSGSGAYPVIRFLAVNQDQDGGIKAPDYMMYMGYAAASNTFVDYYMMYTAESEVEDFTIRMDVVNGTGDTLSVDFGQIEANSIVLH